MIYLQYDNEFKDMLVRIVWVKKYHYNNLTNYFYTDDYIILAEFENDGLQPKFEKLIGNYIPINSKFIEDNVAYKIIYDKLFINGNDWPSIELKK